MKKKRAVVLAAGALGLGALGVVAFVIDCAMKGTKHFVGVESFSKLEPLDEDHVSAFI